MKNFNLLNLETQKLIELSQKLNVLLSSYQVFAANIKGFHWNIQGDNFFTLHPNLDEFNSDLLEKGDGIAERIITIGSRANHGLEEFLKDSIIKPRKDVYKQTQIVEELLDDLQNLIRLQQELIAFTSEIDTVTNDILVGYQTDLEKSHWMYSSYLK